MNRFSAHRDLTGQQAPVSPSVAPTLNFMCGHRAQRAGGQMRGFTPWRCAACAREKARG